MGPLCGLTRILNIKYIPTIGFLLELKKPSSQNSKQPDASMLLASTDKIHIVLIKTDPSGDTHLLGSHFLEWRGILCSPGGRVRNSIELNGVGAEAKVPIGIIDIRMDLIPRLSQVSKYWYNVQISRTLIYYCKNFYFLFFIFFYESKLHYVNQWNMWFYPVFLHMVVWTNALILVICSWNITDWFSG